MEEIIRLEGVSFEYKSNDGPVTAVKQASGIFCAGRVYGILGQPGAGKSALLSLLAGWVVPRKGQVFFQGQDLAALDRDKFRRCQAGVVLRDLYGLPRYSVLENTAVSMELAGWPRKVGRERGKELLKKLGFDTGKMRRRFFELRPEEQQAVAVARALGPKPRLVLVDELEQAGLELLLEAAHKEGACVIFTTSSRKAAAQADKVWGMKDGVLLPVKVD